MLEASIFRAYDIRGIYEKDFDDNAAYQIASAYVALRRLDDDCPSEKPLKIAVGSDMRLSSPKLKAEILKALSANGIIVYDLGLVSTPAFYFAVSSQDLDGGIMISASHNPGNWNGFKLVRRQATPISENSGLLWMRDWILRGEKLDSQTKLGIEEIKDIPEKQWEHDQKYTNLKKIKPQKIVADTANGMGAEYLNILAKNLPGEFIKINFELNGNFPAHEADPIKPENLKQLQMSVLENKADLGIATDGDGDRIFFVDEKGNLVEPAIIRGLLARSFLKDRPGAKIGHDVRPGKITEDLILASNGKPVLTRVGHSLIKEQMLNEDIYFAGESSGHFFLNLPLGCFEMPNIMILRLLEEFSQAEKPLSEYLKPFRKYYSSGEINREVLNKKEIFNLLAEKYAPGELVFLDGITVTYPNYWFNVRASNTENKIRLNLEATTNELMIEKRDEILKLLK
ncbi:MAG: phosphomannomutase/phosphoglucomutase [Patescibacteria group bacterium]|jgi:phosphomannomutase|nr:phosphomannomutase/phosphoglucomutase [Patescibacteria group bacterium]MDD3435127.1 phosphomannomutase/phosphoglucomutase [Patescibacteria group bacterium]MDD4466417.1 phosphomannomutase/phosphoglucomutase [Patescibacteria group bacterium]